MMKRKCVDSGRVIWNGM